MMKRSLLTIAAGSAAVMIGQSASALSEGVYDLLDHGDGTLGQYYGLRMDSLLPKVDDKQSVFSASTGGASVSLHWNGVDSAVISGTLAYNEDANTAATGPLSKVYYTLTGIAIKSNGITATGGTGQVCYGYFGAGCKTLTGKQDTSGLAFLFLDDDHREDPGTDAYIGRGWLTGDPNTTNDWLVKSGGITAYAPPPAIPVPAALPLLAACMAGFGAVAWRRRVREEA